MPRAKRGGLKSLYVENSTLSGCPASVRGSGTQILLAVLTNFFAKVKFQIGAFEISDGPIY